MQVLSEGREKHIHLLPLTFFMAVLDRGILQTLLPLKPWIQGADCCESLSSSSPTQNQLLPLARDLAGGGNGFSHPECTCLARYPPCHTGDQGSVGGREAGVRGIGQGSGQITWPHSPALFYSRCLPGTDVWSVFRWH